MNIAVNLFKLYIFAIGVRIFTLMKDAGCRFQIEQLVVYDLGGSYNRGVAKTQTKY